MKCQHCGQNEATFFCRSTVNGRTTEKRLCQSCAHQLGYAETLRPMRAFESDFFTRPFSLLEGFGSRLLTEFPAPNEAEAAPAEAETLLDEAQRDEFTQLRRRNELERALQTAIEEEKYEEAARLRDELRKMSA